MGLRLVTATRGEAGTGTFEYGRLSLEGTVSRPVGRFALAVTGAAGSSVGRVPVQRQWYMGGLRTVRGQIAGTQSGDAFWLGRAEVGTKFSAVRPVLFYDIGWAGSRGAISTRSTPQRGAGIGLGFLDGLFRVDFSRGLYPGKRWRTDLYLQGIL
jgi:hemolysin activation/secretion protein